MEARPLTPTVFHILLALGEAPRHGYAILKQVEADSAGRVCIAPGTLYNALRRLGEAGLVREIGERPAPELDDERRRYYGLTDGGRRALAAELARLRRAVELAERRLASGTGGGAAWAHRGTTN